MSNFYRACALPFLQCKWFWSCSVAEEYKKTLDALQKTPASTVFVTYHTFKTGYRLRYEFLTVVLQKIQFHWYCGPWWLVDDYWCFEWSYLLHHQGHASKKSCRAVRATVVLQTFGTSVTGRQSTRLKSSYSSGLHLRLYRTNKTGLSDSIQKADTSSL
jgi:hypothetical protein